MPEPARSPDLDKAVEVAAPVLMDIFGCDEATAWNALYPPNGALGKALPLLPSPEQDSRAEYIVQLEEAVERATRLAERYGTAIERISEALPHVTKVRLIIAGLAPTKEEESK